MCAWSFWTAKEKKKKLWASAFRAFLQLYLIITVRLKSLPILTKTRRFKFAVHSVWYLDLVHLEWQKSLSLNPNYKDLRPKAQDYKITIDLTQL